MSELDQYEFKYPQLTPESVQAEIKRTRHNKEVLIYGIVCVLGVLATCVMIYQFMRDGGVIQMIRQAIEAGQAPHASQIFGIIFVILGMIGGVGAVVVIIGSILVMLYRLYGGQLAYSIRVSETNYPEIYAKVKEYTRLLGLDKEPEVYVQQMNGELNAYTSWIPGRAFIQLNAEIVDIAYLEHHDFDTVYFVMAHEFGHIYLHHVQLQYILWSTLISFVPIIGPYVLAPLLARAREYSADRVGQALTNGKSKLECMMLLMAGRHAYRYIDPYSYLRDINVVHNIFERFARWMTNLVSSHPIMPLRTSAFMDPDKKSGKLLGSSPDGR